ncbi:MAG: hypothetical protein OEV79_04445, partial [candidate division WOR-3 bacterium]|nr:hypothetical protein [candidate division WOR-3 bacterium]
KKFVIPTLRRELGDNLVAIAADGSFARNEDTGYSDLELMIFVREKGKLPHGFSKVYDGMLVEGLFVTKREYHNMIHEPNALWFIAGSDVLLPLMNKTFVQRLERYRVRNRASKCAAIAQESIYEVQEAFGKLFNAIDSRNRENLFVVLSDVVVSVLKLLAFINQKPYTSSKKFITEAKKFRKKLEGFDEFIELVTGGGFPDWISLDRSAAQLFKGIENYFKVTYAGKIYDDDLSCVYRKNKNTKRR